MSYYKIFGYPTGLGALLVRRGTLALMRKQYFGGGTVAASCAETTFFRYCQQLACLNKRRGVTSGCVKFLQSQNTCFEGSVLWH